MTAPPERILLVTGRLAEPLVRRIAKEVTASEGLCIDVVVLGISVAGLMHADWIARKLTIDSEYDRVLLPGLCQGDMTKLTNRFGTLFERGPKDIRDLPAFLGGQSDEDVDLSDFDIEILAEINQTPRLDDEQIQNLARHYRDSGADVIDIGTIPGESWSRVGEVTRMLIDTGMRVSIDSFDRTEVEAAVNAGAQLVLSANGSNIDWASQLGAELVVIPDNPRDLSTIQPTLDRLHSEHPSVKFRIDPILEPIGFGFAASLARYFEARRRWPEAAMMMGIGNVTELTDVDTAGVNILLAAVCQELSIGSVLTTEVIGWACSAVREFDLARRLVRHAVVHQMLPKNVDSSLIMLRDPQVNEYGPDTLQQMARQLTDPNFRIFVERGRVHVMNRDGYWQGDDAFELFDQFATDTGPLDPSHAFYLGYELAKAITALTLRKDYQQDEALRWGFLTVPEKSAHERRKNNK